VLINIGLVCLRLCLDYILRYVICSRQFEDNINLGENNIFK